MSSPLYVSLTYTHTHSSSNRTWKVPDLGSTFKGFANRMNWRKEWIKTSEGRRLNEWEREKILKFLGLQKPRRLVIIPIFSSVNHYHTLGEGIVQVYFLFPYLSLIILRWFPCGNVVNLSSRFAHSHTENLYSWQQIFPAMNHLWFCGMKVAIIGETGVN